MLSIHVRCNRWLYYNLPSLWRECEIYNNWETALDCHTYRWVCYHVTRILAFLICDLLNHPIEVEIGDLEEMILLVMVSAFWPMQLVRWHFDHFYIFRTWARIVKGKPVIRFSATTSRWSTVFPHLTQSCPLLLTRRRINQHCLLFHGGEVSLWVALDHPTGLEVRKYGLPRLRSRETGEKKNFHAACNTKLTVP